MFTSYKKFSAIIVTTIALLLAFGSISTSFGQDAVAMEASGTTAFVNVNVIPMDSEQVLEAQTVIVEDGLITAIGAVDEIEVPADAEIIDGEGKYLMPGLADMHTHFTYDNNPDSLRLYLAHGITTVRSLNGLAEHLEWRDQVNNGELFGPTIFTSRDTIVGLPAEYAKLPLIARGITLLAPVVLGLIVWLLVGLASFTPLLSFGQVKRFILPSLAGLLVIGGFLVWYIPLTTYVHFAIESFASIPESAEEARQFVRDQYNDGVDFIKPYNYLPKEHYFAVIDETEKLGLYTAGHTTGYPELIPLEDHFKAGQDEIAHVDEFSVHFWIGYDPAVNEWVEYEFDMDRIDEVAAMAAEYDIAVTPTLITNESVLLGLEDKEGLLGQSFYQTVRPETMESWHTRGQLINWQGQQTYRREQWRVFLMELTGALNEHGVLLNLGTDVSIPGVVPGYSAHLELPLLIEAGLTPFEALSAGTRNPAITAARMGNESNFGTVVAGNRADLILLNNNPLEDVTATQDRIGVMVRGQWFTQVELDALVDEYVASY